MLSWRQVRGKQVGMIHSLVVGLEGHWYFPNLFWVLWFNSILWGGTKRLWQCIYKQRYVL